MTFKTFEGFHIHHYKEVISTNIEALDLIDKGISNETAIIADKQTGGRGRTGKIWLSPKGNLCASLIINQIIDIDKLTEFAFIAALAVGNTLLSFRNDLNLQYKWPNDVLINDKKISGILLEKKFNSDWLVIGIGINITCSPLFKTTCISNYVDPMLNIDLLKELIANFVNLRRRWLSCGFYDIRKMWLKRAFKLNEQISIKLADRLCEGIFTDIDEHGRLVLNPENKNLIYFSAGELFNTL